MRIPRVDKRTLVRGIQQEVIRHFIFT